VVGSGGRLAQLLDALCVLALHMRGRGWRKTRRSGASCRTAAAQRMCVCCAARFNCVCVCICVHVCARSLCVKHQQRWRHRQAIRWRRCCTCWRYTRVCLSAGRMPPRPARGCADGVLKQFQQTKPPDLAGLPSRHPPPQSLLVFWPSAAVRAGTPSDAKRRDSQAHPRHSPVWNRNLSTTAHPAATSLTPNASNAAR
jgi:hypothetical protein